METFVAVSVLLLQVAACVLVADFVSGLFHWLEDSYGNPNWPITGRWITQANDLHHREPRAFLGKNWFQSADVGLLAGALVLGLAALFGVLSWQLVLIVALLVNANEFHKWSHRSRKENPAIVLRLQRWGLLQTPRHHGRHHQGRKDSHYCIVTSYLNPLLDRIGFWRGLEKIVQAVFGVAKRVDPTVANSFRSKVPRFVESKRRHDPDSLVSPMAALGSAHEPSLRVPDQKDLAHEAAGANQGSEIPKTSPPAIVSSISPFHVS